MISIPTLFFLNNVLHKKIRVLKSENILVAWNYPDEKRIWYDYSLVRKEHQKAYLLEEVADLLEKSATTLKLWMQSNIISHPSGRSYKISNRLPNKYYWSENDVLDLRDQLYDLIPKNKYNEPYRSSKLISKAELLQKMRGDSSYYMKDENDNYVKVWKA